MASRCRDHGRRRRGDRGHDGGVTGGTTEGGGRARVQRGEGRRRIVRRCGSGDGDQGIVAARDRHVVVHRTLRRRRRLLCGKASPARRTRRHTMTRRAVLITLFVGEHHYTSEFCRAGRPGRRGHDDAAAHAFGTADPGPAAAHGHVGTHGRRHRPDAEGILARDIKAHPRTIALLYAADRSEHVHDPQSGIEARTRRGELVICDRYLFSSLAYQGLECGDEYVLALNSGFPAAGDAHLPGHAGRGLPGAAGGAPRPGAVRRVRVPGPGAGGVPARNRAVRGHRHAGFPGQR